MIPLLIGLSIVLQAICAIAAGWMWLTSKNGAWRFWLALLVAFIGIIIRRSVWLLDESLVIDRLLAQGLSLVVTYIISLAFLAAMAEAALYHRIQRKQICSMSKEILELDSRLEERVRGRTIS